MTGLYMRVSMGDDDLGERKDESNSIENQRLLLRNFLQGRNDLDGQVKEYVDDGYTGTNFERPAFRRLVEDAKNGIIQVILIKDLSRLGRDYIGVGDYLEQIFPMLGVRLIAVNSNYDSKQYNSKAMNLDVPIQNLVNYFYSRDISTKVRSSLQSRWQEGKPTGSRPPYGYIRDPSNHLKWIPDSNTAPVVQKIFALAMDGSTVKEIVEYLNANEILSPGMYRKKNGNYEAREYRVNENERKWNAYIVRTILRRYSYTGNIVHGQRQAVAPCSRITRKVPKSQQVISENVNPPIISKRQFQEAQKAIQSRDRRPVQTSHQHPLRGKLKCGNCNLSMQISETKGKRYAYCYHASMTGNTSRCYRDTYSLDDIENAVQAVLRVKLLMLTDLRAGLIQKNNKVIAQYEQEMQHLCGRMEAIKSERIRLYSSYAENCISKELYIQKRQSLCEELAKCEDRTQTLKKRCDNMRQVNSRVSSYTDLGKTFTADSFLTHHIVDACIDTVYVYDPQHIEVRLLFEDILKDCVSPTT